MPRGRRNKAATKPQPKEPSNEGQGPLKEGPEFLETNSVIPKTDQIVSQQTDEIMSENANILLLDVQKGDSKATESFIIENEVEIDTESFLNIGDSKFIGEEGTSFVKIDGFAGGDGEGGMLDELKEEDAEEVKRVRRRGLGGRLKIELRWRRLIGWLRRTQIEVRWTRLIELKRRKMTALSSWRLTVSVRRPQIDLSRRRLTVLHKRRLTDSPMKSN